MATQYHYVVMYDNETKEFSIDIDTRIAVMPDGAVFDTETQGWLVDDEDNDDYLEVEDTLSQIIWR
jgi:hypothetical protein